MLIMSSIFILLSSAVSFRRDKAHSFNRITMIVLLYSSILGYETLFLLPLQSGIEIYGGLYQVSSITHIIESFIYMSIIILQLSSAALEKGYIFMALIAIIASVISASYYLGIIKVDNLSLKPNEFTIKFNTYVDNYLNLSYSKYNIYLSTYLCLTISIITLMLLLFITKFNELLSIANILAFITNSYE